MKARPADWIAGIAGIVVLVSTVLDWYFVGPASGGHSQNAWQAFSVVDVLIALVGIGGIVTLIAQGTSRSPAVAVAPAVVTTALSGLVLLVVVYRLINQPGDNDVVGVEPGAYLGLLALLGTFVGAGRSQRDESPRAARATVPVEEMPLPAVGSDSAPGAETAPS